jgi:hypothetical protein
LEKDIEAFIVRIWQEAENIPDSEAVWRGSIVHVGSNCQLYFYNLESIARFIREHTQGNTQEGSHRLTGRLGNHIPNLINRIYGHIYDLGIRVWHKHPG